MRKIKILIAALAAAMLCGCAADSNAVTKNGSSVTIGGASLVAEFPADWTVLTGDEVYEEILKSYPGMYENAAQLKEALTAEGLTQLVSAAPAEGDCMATVSVQDMTDSEQKNVDEYARSVHDTTVFTYQASGYKINEGSFTEETYGGKSGWLSHFEIMTADEEPQLISGVYEFMFGVGDDVYMVQVLYSDAEDKAEVTGIIKGLSAVKKN